MFLEQKDPDWHLYQTISAEITTGAGGLLTARDGSVTLSVPPGAVAETITLVFKPLPAPTHSAVELTFAGVSFELTALDAGSVPLPDFQFTLPVAVSLAYSSAGVALAVESTLRLYYWNTSAWLDAAETCTPPAAYTRNLSANTLSTQFCHLTEFGLYGSPSERIYLPLLSK